MKVYEAIKKWMGNKTEYDREFFGFWLGWMLLETAAQGVDDLYVVGIGSRNDYRHVDELQMTLELYQINDIVGVVGVSRMRYNIWAQAAPNRMCQYRLSVAVEEGADPVVRGVHAAYEWEQRVGMNISLGALQSALRAAMVLIKEVRS